jgi:hypothetical protein
MVSLTGNDVVIVNGRVFHGVADADYVVIEFDNDISAAKVSKDGNTIFALNQTGFLGRMTMRLLRGSPDDIFMNSLLQGLRNDFSAFTLLTGSFTKRVGDGAGNVANDVYSLGNGIFKKLPGAKSNAEGDTEQSVTIYEVWFYNQARAIT